MSSHTQLYVEAHYAAWHYADSLGRKLTDSELSNFIKEYIANAQEI